MSMITLVEQGSTPATPTAGKVRIYVGTDGRLRSVDDAGNVTAYDAGITQEQVEDFVGNLLQDTASVNVTYNDAGNAVTFDVIAGGVDHDALLNFVANEHINHASVSITAGTGLSGGGDITTSRTLNIANTGVSAATYGSASTSATIAVNAQGQITSASNTTITPAAIGAQPVDSDLTAIAALAGTGLIARTGTGTATTRNITAGTGITVTNGDGISGNPTVAANASAINHNVLQNYVANEHVNHASVSINAGTYLTGGGDLTATRTLNHSNSAVTPGTYGGVNAIPVLGIGATGHVDSASTVNPTAALLTGLGSGTDTPIVSTNTILQALANLQAQINASIADPWTELCTKTTYNNSSGTTGVNISELAISVVSGRHYYYEAAILYETATTGTGLEVTMTSPDAAEAEGALLVQMPTSNGDGTSFMHGGTINALSDYVISPNTQAGRHICNVKGTFKCIASGTFNLTFRSESGGNNVAILPSSTMLLRDFGT